MSTLIVTDSPVLASMLKENLQSRPNIYQVLKEACTMQGRDVPVSDVSWYGSGVQVVANL